MMRLAIALLLLASSAAWAQSTDTPLVTGPTFQQVPANQILVTPYGGAQTTLGEALANGGGGGGVQSVVGATGPAVSLGNLVTGGVAPLNNPTFTGTVVVPQPATNDNSGRASTTAWVTAAIAAAGGGGTITPPGPSALGGVFSSAAVAHQWITGITTSGAVTRAQPSCSDLSDAGTGCSSNSTGGSSSVSPTFIPKLPMIWPATNSTQISHAMSGMIMVYAAPTGQANTWTFQATATVGDDVCFYQAGLGTLAFAAASGVTIKAGPGITPGLTTQYMRQCAFFDGTNWVFYNG